MPDIMNDLNRGKYNYKQTSSNNSDSVSTQKISQKLQRQKTAQAKKDIELLASLEFTLDSQNLKKLNQLRQANAKNNITLEKKLQNQYQQEQQNQAIKNLIELNKKDNELKKETKALNQELNLAMAQNKDLGLGTRLKASMQYSLSTAVDKLKKGFDSLLNSLNNLNPLIEKYASYQASINTRLQGSGLTYTSVEGNLNSAIGITPYIKTQTMLDKLNELVSSGISFNLEQRAFLSTISEDIATTFNAANGTLLRLIRLQQEDSTAARLGLEASLTSFLNENYQNTEYMNQSFDDVSANLVEAISQMTTETGVAFEYTVQKWLGALTSVGLSNETVSSISQAIGYLGSGNISALESNSALQNLLVMSASRAGLDYSSLLIDGLNESNTNKLLESMVEYLQEIASTNNQVVKAQYGSIFGMSMSDMTALLNLTAQDVQALANNSLSYSGAIDELSKSINTLPDRIPISQLLDNLFNNTVFDLASNIARNPSLFATWKVTDMIGNLTGGINIPFVSTLGTGVDVNTTVDNLMKLGIVGVSSLGTIGKIINGLSTGFSLDNTMSELGIGYSPVTTTRGSGLVSRQSGETTSLTSYVGTTSGSDFYNQQMQNVQQQNNELIENQMATQENYPKDIKDILIGDKTSLLTKINSTSLSVLNTAEINSEKLNLISSLNSNVEAILTALTEKGIVVRTLPNLSLSNNSSLPW